VKGNPFDRLALSGLESGDEEFIIVPQPYDAGDRISYHYNRKRDTQRIRTEIQSLKDSLAESDYQITKCYEAFMLGAELPYDVESLHRERQSQRDRINELEEEL